MTFRLDPAWLVPEALETASALAAPLYARADVAQSERSAIFARNIDFDYLYESDSTRSGKGDAQQRAQDQNFSDEVQHEDIAICELVQQWLGSGSYFAGRLNPKRESGVHHFHELYRRALRT